MFSRNSVFLHIFIVIMTTSLVKGFGINIMIVPEDDPSQVICTLALLNKYFRSGESLSGSVLSMSITSASINVQQNLLRAIHMDRTHPWTVIINDARKEKPTTSAGIALHEKPQCYFVIVENLENEDLEDMFEKWKSTINWNPMAQFVVYIASVEETDDEMTELMIEILLNFLNKKIYNINVIGQNDENGFFYGKTVFPYHPDNNCGNRVIAIETLDICDYQEAEQEHADEDEEYVYDEGNDGNEDGGENVADGDEEEGVVDEEGGGQDLEEQGDDQEEGGGEDVAEEGDGQGEGVEEDEVGEENNDEEKKEDEEENNGEEEKDVIIGEEEGGEDDIINEDVGVEEVSSKGEEDEEEVTEQGELEKEEESDIGMEEEEETVKRDEEMDEEEEVIEEIGVEGEKDIIKEEVEEGEDEDVGEEDINMEEGQEEVTEQGIGKNEKEEGNVGMKEEEEGTTRDEKVGEKEIGEEEGEREVGVEKVGVEEEGNKEVIKEEVKGKTVMRNDEENEEGGNEKVTEKSIMNENAGHKEEGTKEIGRKEASEKNVIKEEVVNKDVGDESFRNEKGVNKGLGNKKREEEESDVEMNAEKQEDQQLKKSKEELEQLKTGKNKVEILDAGERSTGSLDLGNETLSDMNVYQEENIENNIDVDDTVEKKKIVAKEKVKKKDKKKIEKDVLNEQAVEQKDKDNDGIIKKDNKTIEVPKDIDIKDKSRKTAVKKKDSTSKLKENFNKAASKNKTKNYDGKHHDKKSRMKKLLDTTTAPQKLKKAVKSSIVKRYPQHQGRNVRRKRQADMDFEEQNIDSEHSSKDDEAAYQGTMYMEEHLRALFLDKFPRDLSGCTLVAAFRSWEPYIFSLEKAKEKKIENPDDDTAGEGSGNNGEPADGSENGLGVDGFDEAGDVAGGVDIFGDTEIFGNTDVDGIGGGDGDGPSYDGDGANGIDKSDDFEPDTSQIEGDLKLSGIEYKMVQTIAERLHINIDIQVENNNLYQLFQQLIDGDIEMVVGGIDEDPSISQFVSSTIPYYQDDLTWCVAKAKRQHNLFNFLASFRVDTWLLTQSCVLLLSLTVLLTQRTLKIQLAEMQGYFRISLRMFGVVITTQSMQLKSMPTALKITLGSAFFMSLMFSNIYQSFLVSTLTNPKSMFQISHITEIYHHRMAIMGSVENVRHMNKDGEIFKYIREKFEMCYNIEECLNRAATDDRVAVAVSRLHTFYNPRIPRDLLYCFDRDENLYAYLVTMLLPKKFHLLHMINPVIQHVIESGHMQKWSRDLDSKRQLEEETRQVREAAVRSLNLAEVGGSFAFSAFLLLFAFCVFVTEYWVYRIVTQRRTRLILVKILHKQFS